MIEREDYVELVEQAQRGDGESLNSLCQLGAENLRAYIYRLTLRDDLTEDIVQDSLLEMVKFLDQLESADRFWPWLRTIAVNKLYHQTKRQQLRKTVALPEAEYTGSGNEGEEGLKNLVYGEWKQIITEAMGRLKPSHRHVLILRCYEGLAYSAIAEEMDRSEFSVRMLFFRAKKSLAKQLSRRGIGKGSLLIALVLFGKMTAPSKAAAADISVTAATLKVGAAAALAGMAGSKSALVTMATVGLVAVGSVMVMTSVPDKPSTVFDRGLTRVTSEIAEDVVPPDRSLDNVGTDATGRSSDTTAAQNKVPNMAVVRTEIVDIKGDPITATAGKRFWVRVYLTYYNPTCIPFTISRTVNGWTQTAPPVNWGCGRKRKTRHYGSWGPWVMHRGGIYPLTVTIDAENAITESNEDDNTLTTDLLVTGTVTAEWELVDVEYGRENLGDGTGVIVGIMDDAFDFLHPLYSGNDSIGNRRLVASKQNTLGPEGSPINAKHATAVMGIVLARGLNDGDITGLAPDARYVTAEFRNLTNEPNLSVMHVLDAAGFLVNNGADVINMSWSKWSGSDSDSTSGETVVTNLMADYLAYGRNIVCVAIPDRLENLDTPAAPGSSRNVITVGGLDRTLQRAWSLQNHGPTLDGRCKPDLLANNADSPVTLSAAWRIGMPTESDYDVPWEWYHDLSGKVLYSLPIEYSDNDSEPYFGTEYSAAFVAGAAVQMLDYGRSNNQNTDHRVIKAIIMNSGIKAEDADGSPWSNSPTQPLDDQQGTGILNIRRVHAMYSASEQSPETAAVPGYDFGQVAETIDDGPTAGRVVYNFGQLQTPDADIDVTLVWDRHTFWNDTNNNKTIDANDTFFTDQNDLQDNLDMVLYYEGDEIAASRSIVDNVEHISLTGLEPGVYQLHIERLAEPNSGDSEDYAIAWYSNGSWQPLSP